MIYGDDQLQQMFARTRHETLCLARNATVLQQEVREMRQKWYSIWHPLKVIHLI